MIRLNILNMNNFLQAVNTCGGCVNLISPDGSRENINKQYAVQDEILKEYRENKNSMHLTLDIPNSTDYMNIVSYYVGDC